MGGGRSTSLSRYIDHTLLKPHATYADIELHCREAAEWKFAAVAVNPTHVSLAAGLLANTGVKVAAAIGFPLGATTTTTKAAETREAIADGATEIDMVINIGALKSGDIKKVGADISGVVLGAAGKALVKVIIETCFLSQEEKILACRLAKDAGAHFVKTSTGLGSGGATIEDVRLMRETVGPDMGVKAAGGIRDAKTAWAMVEAGATRIGTSNSVAIVCVE
jgi:deoxyribose-phosphate aldolase